MRAAWIITVVSVRNNSSKYNIFTNKFGGGVSGSRGSVKFKSKNKLLY